MKGAWIPTLAVCVVLGLTPQVADACVSVYLDFNENAATEELDAWADVEDCDMEIGFYYEHYYTATVYIESPSQNTASDYDSSTMPYGGGSANAAATISFDDDFGPYDVILEVEILCSFAGPLFGEEDIDNPVLPSACTTNGTIARAIATMIGWSPLAYERGGTIICSSSFPVTWHLMDSFEEVFSGSYYEPTEDPCKLGLHSNGSPLGGFHSHPLFNSNSELNRGKGCHEGTWSLSSSEIDDLNADNASFSGQPTGTPEQKGDHYWGDQTSSPLFLLVPEADEIKMLPLNHIPSTVYPPL